MEFPDLALTKFLQTAPQLGALISNFVDISEQAEGPEDSGLQVGVFTLGAGTENAFVPVVAKGSTVYPIDSVFYDTTKMFVPLTPKTSAALATSLGNSIGSSLGKAKKIPAGVVQNPDITALVSPPRTGKYAYASESRLVEFMAVLPDYLKDFAFEKISSEKSVYDALDSSFGLRALFSVLRTKADNAGSTTNATGTGPDIFQKTTLSVITTPREIKDLGSEAAAQAFMQDGYYISGVPTFSRTVVPARDLKNNSYTQVSPLTNAGSTYDISLTDGSCIKAFLPKFHKLNDIDYGSLLPSIFEDGTFARGMLIAHGDPTPGTDGLSRIFDNHPPKLLKDCIPGERILLITGSGEALGPYVVSSVVLTNSGVQLKVDGSKTDKIIGMRSFSHEADRIDRTLYVPSNIIVQALGEERIDVERSVSFAATRGDIFTSALLASELVLTHDGVEFSINRSPVGGTPAALKYLVEKEEIEPGVAKSFLKQAEQDKRLVLYMSKRASAGGLTPAEIPQYGERLDTQDKPGLNGSFMPAIQSAMSLQDSQTTEATIISQLLQVPDMSEYIKEYMPDLEASLDKLGRILFVIRLKFDELSSDMDADSMFAMVDKIRNVYRQLGDTVNSLKETSNSLTPASEAGSGV